MLGQKTVLKWALAVLALLLLFLLPDGCTVGAKGVFKNIVTPIQSFFLQTGRSLKEGADSIRGFSGLADENRRLYQEVVALQAEVRLNENLKNENIHLREMLSFRDQQQSRLIPAEVAARSISGWWQSIRLAKGSLDGVYENRAVISPDGLVGRTAEVSSHTADVLLLSDPACKVSARIRRTGSFGLVSGRGVNLKGYPVARMQFIHKDIPLQVGDEVVTSGLGGVFPKDVLIGYIEKIYTEEGGLYQVADLLPQAVVSLADVVFVTADDGEGTQ